MAKKNNNITTEVVEEVVAVTEEATAEQGATEEVVEVTAEQAVTEEVATTTKKLTEKEKYAKLLAIPEVEKDPILSQFIKDKMEGLEKKKKKAQEKRANSSDNDKYKSEILAVLATKTTPVRIAEIQKDNQLLGELSNQKMSYLLGQLINIDGRVEKTVEKKLTYFSLATNIAE